MAWVQTMCVRDDGVRGHDRDAAKGLAGIAPTFCAPGSPPMSIFFQCRMSAPGTGRSKRHGFDAGLWPEGETGGESCRDRHGSAGATPPQRDGLELATPFRLMRAAMPTISPLAPQSRFNAMAESIMVFVAPCTSA